MKCPGQAVKEIKGCLRPRQVGRHGRGLRMGMEYFLEYEDIPELDIDDGSRTL